MHVATIGNMAFSGNIQGNHHLQVTKLQCSGGSIVRIPVDQPPICQLESQEPKPSGAAALAAAEGEPGKRGLDLSDGTGARRSDPMLVSVVQSLIFDLSVFPSWSTFSRGAKR